MPGPRQEIGGEVHGLAVVVVGTGPDFQEGWDDEINRDHHWGPRAAIFYPEP